MDLTLQLTEWLHVLALENASPFSSWHTSNSISLEYRTKSGQTSLESPLARGTANENIQMHWLEKLQKICTVDLPILVANTDTYTRMGSGQLPYSSTGPN